MAFDSVTGLREGIDQIYDNSGGAMEIFIVRRRDMARLFTGALLGYRRARVLATAVNDFLARPAKTCLVPTCERTCPRPDAVVIAMPARDDPMGSLVVGACRRHAASMDDVELSRAMQGWLKRAGLDLREIEVVHDGGRA